MTTPERSLLRAWGAMMGLSAILAVVADAARPERLLMGWLMVAGVVAWFKARIVLSAYLGLKQSPAARAAFSVAVACILAAIVSSFGLERMIAMLPASSFAH